MFLAIDIGNSSLKIGLYDGDDWAKTFQIEHAALRSENKLQSLLTEHHIGAVGIASVVPETTARVSQLLKQSGTPDPLIVSANIDLPFSIGYKTPETLGADRIAAVAGALSFLDRHDLSPPLVIVDAGTAVTIEVVSEERIYVGGAISPGPALLQSALATGTAQLPEVEWEYPASSIGTSTTDAIQAGLVIPFLGGIRNLLRQTIEEAGDSAVVLATGGWASWLASHISEVQHVVSTLVLDGVRVLKETQLK